MKSVKMFFVAAALVLVTAGVFAGKARFATYTLQAYNSAGYTPLGSITPNTNLSLVTSGTPISFSATISGTPYSLYALSGSTEYRVQTTF